MQIIEILTITGGVFGILLSLHLFMINRIEAAAFLGLFVLSLTILLIEPLAGYANLPVQIISLLMSVFSFLAGPAIYLYCLRRARDKIFSFRWLIHFIPSAVLAVLVMASPDPDKSTVESGDEIVLYLMFVAQVVFYLALSFRIAASRHQRAEHIADRMPQSFVAVLVYSTIVLFAFSFISTFLGFNRGNAFVTTVQVLLNIVIIIVALLNTDGLEHRPKREFIKP